MYLYIPSTSNTYRYKWDLRKKIVTNSERNTNTHR